MRSENATRLFSMRENFEPTHACKLLRAFCWQNAILALAKTKPFCSQTLPISPGKGEGKKFPACVVSSCFVALCAEVGGEWAEGERVGRFSASIRLFGARQTQIRMQSKRIFAPAHFI